MNGRYWIAALAFASVLSAHGALQITSIGTSVSIDFGGFTGAGFAPTPTTGQLDSDDWRVTGLSYGDGSFGGTHTTDDFARSVSSGGVNTGGIYAFNVEAGNRALGIQPGGSDFTPGTFTLRLQNDTGGTVSALDVGYLIYVFNDQPRANSFNFSFSTDDNTYTSINALNFTSPEAASSTPAWTSSGRSTTISGLSWGNTQYFYLRWSGDDVGGSGNRDEFALDNISITAVPEPAEWGLISALGLFAVAGLHSWRNRRRRRAA